MEKNYTIFSNIICTLKYHQCELNLCFSLLLAAIEAPNQRKNSLHTGDESYVSVDADGEYEFFSLFGGKFYFAILY